MLNDAQRKLFTVLYNYFSQNRKMPSFNILKQFTGKTKEDCIMVLDELTERGYIEWSNRDPETILILQYIKPVKKNTSNVNYFTDH